MAIVHPRSPGAAAILGSSEKKPSGCEIPLGRAQARPSGSGTYLSWNRTLHRKAFRVATSPVENDDESVLNLVRLGAVVVAIVLTACAEAPSADTASQTSTSLAIQDGNTTTTTGTQQARVARRVGQPFMLGDVQLKVVSVQDPFPSTAQLQPAAGRRLVSVKYEVVSQTRPHRICRRCPRSSSVTRPVPATSRSMAG